MKLVLCAFSPHNFCCIGKRKIQDMQFTTNKDHMVRKDATIIISTPQGLENDTINSRVKLEEVSLLIFDEAHHATGEYSYVWLAQQYEKIAKYPRILALTASPGSDLESIKEICKNLHIEKVEVRTEHDPDVKPYIQQVKLNWIKVEFPDEFKKVQKYLQECKKSKLIEVQHHGYCHDLGMNKTGLLALQGELHQKISQGERDFEMIEMLVLPVGNRPVGEERGETALDRGHDRGRAANIQIGFLLAGE